MPYLIDGHNLIPKVGLRLDSVDDEIQLIELLQSDSRSSRTAIEVFFDGAPAGHAGSRKFGRITATFVHQASSADAAIMQRLMRLGREARNWTVVSSDRQVLLAALAARAHTETAEKFASRLGKASVARREGTRPSRLGGKAGGMSESEIQDWLELFKKRGT